MQITQNGILRFAIAEEKLLSFFNVLLDSFNRFLNMNEVQSIVFHRGRASSSTLSLMNQCKPS